MKQVLISYTCCCLMCDVAFDVVASTALNGDVAIVVVAGSVFVAITAAVAVCSLSFCRW